jgi:fatty-acyl-CoA synthase
MQTLGAFLDAAAARAPEREALAWAERDVVTERRTWRELRDASRFAARKLLGVGVGKGTRVGLLCPNRPEWLLIAFGALRLGAVLVPFSTLWKREEIAYGLSHGDVQVLLTRAGFLKHDYLADLTALVPELDDTAPGRLQVTPFPALRRVILLAPGTRRRGGTRGAERWHELEPAADDAFLDAVERTISPTDVATVFFTSGTTAQAKAVVHAHGALTTSGGRIGEALGITSEDAWWGHMPLFWSGGFILGALATIARGGRLVLQEQVDAASALVLLEAERCTIMAGWHQAGPLLEHPEFAPHRVQLRKGSYHTLADRLLAPDHVAVGMYGMSETATCVACARWNDPPTVRRETFGRPLEGMDVRIVDPDTRHPVAPGEQGEIIVKGPTLMESYYRVPRSETFDPEGYFHTGDLGWFDGDGCLHFAGRLKDVIKTAGVNVAAAEVEEALARHPAVKAAHVVGVPHPTRGENVAAFVVARPGAEPDPAALADFVRASLASYKVPRHVFVIDEAAVPRTATGKIEKPALRREAERRLQE